MVDLPRLKGQKRKFNEKRKAGGGGGIDFGKAVSSADLDLKESS
jgi:hypothetical protein